MSASKRPATLVLCATAPRQPTPRTVAWLEAARSLTAPVTWIAGIETMAEIAEHGAGIDVAIDIPPTVCGSKARLRELVSRGRDAIPDLSTAVLRGPTPSDHRSLLVEQGISVALVDGFEEDSRGSRRPAPKGWPCRNVIWGLWEVTVSSPRAAGIAGWLGLGGAPAAKPGSLQVLRTDGILASHGGRAAIAPRLDRWIAWANQRRFRGTAVTAGLADVPALITGCGREAVADSILRAA